MKIETWIQTCALFGLPLLAVAGCSDSSGDGSGGDESSTETGDSDGGSEGDGDGDPTGDGDGDPTGDGDGEGCTPGEITCVDGVANICDDSGDLSEETCDDACADGLGCVLCLPGSGECNGDTASMCNDDGSAWEDSECDPLQGLMCDGGSCEGACAEITGGFLGCDFYPTVSASMNELNAEFKLGAVVSNFNDQGVNVCITQGGSDQCDQMGFIGPNTVQTYEFDDVPELQNSMVTTELQPSVLIEDASYRIRTDLPVSVYQFNPHQDYVANSADASLLFPVRAWDLEYVVVSRNHWQGVLGQVYEFPGFYTVVASEQDTTVTLLPSNSGGFAAPGGGVAADGTGEVTLHRGDVLQVHSWRDDASDPLAVNPSDLTGTRVKADKPIQVIGGSKCTNVPFDTPFCDRLEDSMMPLSLASDNYIASAPVQPGSDGMMVAQRMVRIVATEDDTNISYNPNVQGAPTSIAYAGDYIEFAETSSFQVNASKNVLVAEYMTSGQFGGGDPSMAMTMPTSGYLTDYLIYAPPSYQESWVNIVFDKDTVIELNGATIIDASGATQVGVSDWRVTSVALPNDGDGTHRLVIQDGGMPFGLTVYGYSPFISYWYPGGLDLPPQP